MTTIKQKLADLPRTLEGTYERIFKEMDPEYEREIRIALIFPAFSSRPMTIEEVAEATAFDLKAQNFDLNDRFPDPDDLLELCSSLVSVVMVKGRHGTVFDKESSLLKYSHPFRIRVLQLAHFSVKRVYPI